VLTQDRRFFRAAASDFDQVPARVAHIDLPRSGSSRSARYRRDLAARLADAADAGRVDLSDLGRRARHLLASTTASA